jgi:acetyl esterase/lipase
VNRRFRTTPIFAALAFAAFAPAIATPPGMDPANSNRPADMMGVSDGPVRLGYADLPFGKEKDGGRIEIDVSPLHGRRPIIIQIGDWYSSDLSTAWLPSFLHGHGYRVAQVYDVHAEPDHDGAALAANLAKGIAALIAKADRYRFDPNRIVLMSCAEGGDLAALLATDPTYLRQAGVRLESVRGVLLIDGAGFDLAAYLPTLSHYLRKSVEEVLGKDPELQARISAIRHVEPSNAPAFLFETVKGNAKSQGQADAMAAALRQAGTAAEVVPVSRSWENDPSTYPGQPTSPANGALLRFLQTAAGQP